MCKNRVKPLCFGTGCAETIGETRVFDDQWGSVGPPHPPLVYGEVFREASKSGYGGASDLLRVQPPKSLMFDPSGLSTRNNTFGFQGFLLQLRSQRPPEGPRRPRRAHGGLWGTPDFMLKSVKRKGPTNKGLEWILHLSFFD